MSDTIVILILSGFFTLLGVFALRVIGKLRSIPFLLLGYLVGDGVIVALFEIKYILLSALLFFLGCTVYSVYVIVKEFNQCSKELTALRDGEKNE